jgi:chorismate--pyruvate lyase
LKRTAALSGWLPRVPPHAGAYRHWLVDRGSLTRRLQERCDRFQVRPVCQRLALSCIDEQLLLGLGGRQLAVTREVFLYCGETPVVFAHSVVHRDGLVGAWRWLGTLGARPLGAALFSDPTIARSPLAFRRIGSHHRLFPRATARLASPPVALWARRSVFLREDSPLLVTEVFLPGILDLPQ